MAELDLKTEALRLNLRLQKMSDEERFKYITDTITALNGAIDSSLNDEAKAAQLTIDLKNTGHIIMGCVLYSFEPRYREMYAELLTKIWAVV